MKEGQIQRECMEALTLLGLKYIRLQSGMVKVRGAYMHLSPAGTSDLLVIMDEGRCIWLETKQLKGKQREAQKEFQASMEALGHEYRVIRAVEDVLTLFAPSSSLSTSGTRQPAR